MFRGKALLALLGALAVGAGCSLMLDFDEDGRPCGPDENPRDGLGDCLDDYSCLVNRCVRNHSVAVGSTCGVNAHCEQGAVCTTSPHVCRRQCSGVYSATECGSAGVCLPMTDASGAAVAACGASECEGTAGCEDSDATCVLVKPGVGHCLPACSVTCDGGGCTDNCHGVAEEAESCQPVGESLTLACLPAGQFTHGLRCNLVDRFCTENQACIDGVCLEYCDSASPDSCAGLLDPSTTPQEPAQCNPVAGRGFSVCGTVLTPPPADGGPQGDGGNPDGAPGDRDPGLGDGHAMPDGGDASGQPGGE